MNALFSFDPFYGLDLPMAVQYFYTEGMEFD
jgi:hypothetical protein